MKFGKYSAILFVLTLSALVLSSCREIPAGQPFAAGPAAAQGDRPAAVTPTPALELSNGSSKGTIIWADGQPKLDEQGAITVQVKSINLNNPGETLDFEVAMNTHSVDLSMDLAALATLTTDKGKTVVPLYWDAPAGGHHVTGMLSFPASVDGIPVLEGVSKLTLTLVDVDAPKRVFEWNR